MTDPFDALREPVAPVDPDPAFAARLRDRLSRAVLGQPLGQPGDAMTQTSAQVSNQTAEREPAWAPALVPYIVVADARRALAWYVDVLGGEQRGEPYVNDDGTIGHAEVGLGDAVLMLAEASDLWPDVPVHAPEGALHSHTLHLQVDDVDATTERARRAGAAVEREPADQPYGRGSVIVDPFGHRWMLLRPPGRATRYRQGDVANVSIVARDAERAKAVLRGGAAGAVLPRARRLLEHRGDDPADRHLVAGRGRARGGADLPGRRPRGRGRAGALGGRPRDRPRARAATA